MKAMAPLSVRPTNTATTNDSLAAGMTAAFGGGRQETLRPPESGVAQSMQILPRFPSDSLVYAMARLFGLKSAADYLSLNMATVAGYRSMTDEQAAVKGAFCRPGPYYDALRIGVTTFPDFETVWFAGIRTKEMAARYLTLIADLRSRKSEYNTNGPNELAVAYVLTRLPAATPDAVVGILRRPQSIETSFLLPQPHSMDLLSRATHMVAGDRQPLPGVGDVTDLSEYSEIPRDSGMQELVLELQNAWEQLGHISRRAPAVWRQEHGQATNVEEDQGFEPLSGTEEVEPSDHKQAWARGIGAARLAPIWRRSTRLINSSVPAVVPK